jgi:predicted transcriptional regulator
MASLDEILKKTKDKSEKINITRKPPSIATKDRPYSVNQALPDQLVEIDNKPSFISNQLVTNISNLLVINKEPVSNPIDKDDIFQKTNKEPISKRISNHNKESISNQLVSELVTIQSIVSKISGHQRKILFYIVEDCIYRGKLISGFITNEILRNITNTTAHTVKTATQRLIKKGLLKRETGQRGQGGFSSFTITQEIREAVLKEKRNPSISNQLVSGLVTAISNPLVTNKEADKEPRVLSSSSSLRLKETTTGLDEEWKFDIASYTSFGFSKTQIQQLASLGTISAIQVQQSLMEFNHDLENDNLPPIKTNKLNFLMGLLRTGHCYISESYRNEQEKTIKLMAERIEKRKRAILEEKFILWEDALSKQEKQDILNKTLPRHLKIEYQSYGMTDSIKRVLFGYYTQSVLEKEESF